MIRQFCAAVVVLGAARSVSADSGPYVPYSGIIHGTEGAVPVPLTIRNDTAGVVGCQASLAHWYSVDLGRVEAGGTLQVTLWHDPATGRMNLLNETQDRMPVEAVWCGRPPKMYDTRGRVDLPFDIGTTPADLRRLCQDGPNGHLACIAGD